MHGCLYGRIAFFFLRFVVYFLSLLAAIELNKILNGYNSDRNNVLTVKKCYKVATEVAGDIIPSSELRIM